MQGFTMEEVHVGHDVFIRSYMYAVNFTMMSTSTALYNHPTRVNHFFICAFYNKFPLLWGLFRGLFRLFRQCSSRKYEEKCNEIMVIGGHN